MKGRTRTTKPPAAKTNLTPTGPGPYRCGHNLFTNIPAWQTWCERQERPSPSQCECIGQQKQTPGQLEAAA